MSDDDKVNILLVDDQPAKLLSYEAILGNLGDNLIKVGSGQDALRQLMARDIAVMLIDVCMPEMDGFELARLIREHPRYRRTAILLVSAVALSDLDRLRGYDCGAVDYIPVPIVPEVLRAKVAVFAELWRRGEALRKLNAELEQRVFERTAALEASTALLREKEEWLRIALQAGRLGAWELDLQNGVMNTTPVFNTTMGLPPDASLDRGRFLAAVHEKDRDQLQNVLAQAAQSESDFETEYRCQWPDGSTHWIIARGGLIHARGARRVVLGVILDATDRRRAEEERALLLESERAARVEAEHAVRIKDDFLAMLSHELRTPLNAILGWTQLLRLSGGDGDRITHGLETIERNARDQARLINDLLDVSRIAAGRIHLERQAADFARVVEAALETMQPVFRAKELLVRREFNGRAAPVNGDLGRLQQVVSNLLSNACKFTPPGGQITVSLQSVGSQIELQVSDNGEGIAPDFLPFVFDRFRQADNSATRHHGGLGLGLAIAKHLVELHGGTISVRSAGQGQGACFTVCLPATAATASEAAAARPAAPADEPDFRTCACWSWTTTPTPAS